MNWIKKLSKKTVKRQTEPVYKVPLSIQDTIPIHRIAKSGIFELENPFNDKTLPHLYDKAYLFEDINYSTQDEPEKEKTAAQFERLLRSNNVSYKIIVCNHLADNQKLRDSILHKPISEDMSELAKVYNELIEDRMQEGRNGLLQSKYFIITCIKPDFESARNYFNTVEYSIQQSFHRLGSGLIPLNATERLRVLHSFYRMGEEASFDFDWDRYLTLRRDWRNDIINTSLLEDHEFLLMDGHKYACALFVRNIGNSVSDQFMHELTNLNFPLMYTMDVEPMDVHYAYQMIMKKYMANERSIEKEQELKTDHGDFSTNISYERRKQQKDTEEMLDRISSFDERLLFVGMTILIRADSMEELEDHKEKIFTIGKTHNMDIVTHSHNQLAAMNTTLPTGSRFVDTMRAITSEELSAFIPFNVQEIQDNAGYCYGYNQVSKNLIMANRKKLKNGNGIYFGVSGSGKSFSVKMEMGQVLAFSDDKVYVIDPMGEYKDQIEKWNGKYINLTQSQENQYYVNPFHVPEGIYDRDKFVADKAEFGFAIAEQAIEPIPCTSRHTAIIDRAVRQLYGEYFEAYDKTRSKKKRAAIESPTISSIRQWIIENENADDDAVKDLVYNLEPFANGTMDIFSRQQSSLDDNRLLVFGFADLGKKMKSMAMLIMIETITAQIKYNQANGVTSWVYIDEMHELWGHEFSLHSLERMWREVRKRGGICTGMSQNVIDALQNRSTKTILSNSEFMVLLDQGGVDRREVEKLFAVSVEQISFLNDADIGTGLIRFGDKIVPFDNTVPKDSSLYRLYNTNFHEKVAMEKQEKSAV